MTKEEKYNQYFLQRALDASKMSYCERLQVGAVAVRDNRTILDGWNGTLPTESNCCEEEEPCSCLIYLGDDNYLADINCKVCNGKGYISYTKPSTIHAERNIIFYAARKGISLEGATMYITHSPCIGCAQAMAAVGISKVVYAKEYRDKEGIHFLLRNNISSELIPIKE